MKHIYRGIAVVLFYGIAIALLVYAASRSLDFIARTLPPEQRVVGLLALAATSGGAIAWLMVFLHHAAGTGQKVVSALMIGVDLLGEFSLFAFDTLLSSGENGMTAALAPEDVRMVILGLSALVAVNILATFAFHITDPSNARDMREASVRDNLENQALALIEKRGEEIAQNLAPALAEQWAREFEARFSDLRALGLGNQADTAPRPALGWPAKRAAPTAALNMETELPGELAPSGPLAVGNGNHRSPNP